MKKIAYLILAHTDEEHLKKLVRAIDYNCDIYVHIDKKSSLEKFTSIIDQPNVYFLKNRVSVHWAHFSMIEAQICLISEVIKKKDSYTHAIFISGSCFPIQNKIKIYRYFSSQPKKEFIKYFDMRESPRHLDQIKYKWFRKPLFTTSNSNVKFLDRAIRFILRKLHLRNYWNPKMVPYFGSQWIALTMDCCQYVYDFHMSNKWFVKMNQSTFSPDEHYFHTIVGNSSFAENATGLQPCKDRMATYMMANYHIIDPSLNKWFEIKDWEEICNSNMLFVRKLNSVFSTDLITKITTELLELDRSVEKQE